MSQYYRLPAQTINASNPSVGVNGASAPASSTQASTVDPSGNAQPLQSDASKNLKVAVQSVPSNQSVNVTQVNSSALNLGQQLSAASLPVVLPATQISTLTPLSTVGLNAGTNLVGKFGIDQTTPGTTNGVQLNGTLPAGTNLLGKVGIDQTTPGTTNGVQVNAPIPAGANLIGKFGIDQTTPGTTNGVQVNAALPAGGNLIGKTGIDQTTPGTTNAVALSTIGTVAPSVGNGTSNTGTLRVVLASDQTSNTNPLLTNARQLGAFTDRSGTTSATASTSTTIAPTNAARKYLMIVNTSASNTIWVNFTTAASVGQPSIPISPYGSFVMESGFVTTEAVNVICTAASSPFAVKEG